MQTYKSGITAFLCVAIMLLVNSLSAQFAGGNGTSSDPYQIKTAEQLNNVRKYLGSANAEKYFKVMNEISLYDYQEPTGAGYNNGKFWQPIGDSLNMFAGNFDGCNNVIHFFKLKRPLSNHNGLFGCTAASSVIKNVQLQISSYDSFLGRRATGGLVGWNKGTVQNCLVTGKIQGKLWTGGIVGWNDGTITGSISTVVITSTGNSSGGVAGQNEGAINHCYATGSVNGFDFVGGLVGHQMAGSITKCYANGAITNNGNAANKGGLIGYSTGSVTASYWDINTTGLSNSYGSDPAFGKTSEQMKTQSTYVGWDFMNETVNGTNDYWGINPVHNYGYPFLRWEGYVQGLLGVGTESNPYQIFSIADLEMMRQYSYIDEVASRCYKLMNNLDFIGYKPSFGWEPFGDDLFPFKGKFDGNNHKITGLTINKQSEPNCKWIGFFGLIAPSAKISNLGVETSNDGVNGFGNVGILAGKNSTGSIISNCYASGSVLGAFVVGGLVGTCFGTITNCYTTGSIIGNNFIGGLTGVVNPGTTISNCYSTSTVAGTYNTSGLVGYKEDGVITITNSFWNKTVNPKLPENGCGTGKTTAVMQKKSTYAGVGWDFDAVWKINEDKEYPRLMWEPGSSAITAAILPTETVLYANYPNPFNPSTEIRFDLKSAGVANLTVYNAKGELVKTMVSGMQTAGVHSVVFDGANLNSGVYFYKLEVAGKSAVNKMLLVK